MEGRNSPGAPAALIIQKQCARVRGPLRRIPVGNLCGWVIASWVGVLLWMLLKNGIWELHLKQINVCECAPFLRLCIRLCIPNSSQFTSQQIIRQQSLKVGSLFLMLHKKMFSFVFEFMLLLWNVLKWIALFYIMCVCGGKILGTGLWDLMEIRRRHHIPWS